MNITEMNRVIAEYDGWVYDSGIGGYKKEGRPHIYTDFSEKF
jgi:hypothetical protein